MGSANSNINHYPKRFEPLFYYKYTANLKNNQIVKIILTFFSLHT